MFSKILIANRGEIACRVIAPPARWVSPPSPSTPMPTPAHVHMCAWRTRRTTLAAPLLLTATCGLTVSWTRSKQPALKRYIRATAFFPRTPGLPKRWTEAGIAFIGPGIRAITSMGDKITSKQLAAEAGCKHHPGLHRRDRRCPDHAVSIARDIGYPVMLKASAGGGGKGMRVVLTMTTSAATASSSTRAEARSSFGDDRDFCREVHRRASPHRNSDHGRPARQRDLSGRTRMLHPASAPESHRGSALTVSGS